MELSLPPEYGFKAYSHLNAGSCKGETIIRSYYSKDTLKAKTDNFKNMPDITKFKSGAQFYGGTVDQVMLRYMVAKYEVGRWYSPEKLSQLIKDLNSGKSFDESFKN